MLGSINKMWLAGVRRGACSIIPSSHGSLLHSKPVDSISRLRSSLFSLSSASEDKSRLRSNTWCLEQSRCWNVSIVQGFSTGPGPRRKRSQKQICSEDGCFTTATYGWEGGRREFCAKHKKEAMIQLAARLCEHPDKCQKQANFGFPGHHPTHCHAHKLEGMEDVKNQKCKKPGCRIRATFGLHGGKATRCGAHRLEGMEDVLSPRCQEPGCEIQAGYGYLDGKRRFCTSHKLEHMVSLKTKKAARLVKVK